LYFSVAYNNASYWLDWVTGAVITTTTAAAAATTTIIIIIIIIISTSWKAAAEVGWVKRRNGQRRDVRSADMSSILNQHRGLTG